jgi:hypothetical protein
MKKLLLIFLIVFFSCRSEEEILSDIQKEIKETTITLENYRKELSEVSQALLIYQQDIESFKALETENICLVTLEIYQSTFTLNIGEHIKNKVNKIKIQLPVDPIFYNDIKIGDDVFDKMKWGSFLFDGDISSLHAKVIEKNIRPR